MDWAKYELILQVLASGIAIALPVWRWVWRPFAVWRRKLALAIDELVPNGGSSIKDLISRIDATTTYSSARVLALLDRDVVPTYECDPTGKCTYANEALCKMFGLSREEILADGTGWLEGLLPDERSRVFKVWMEAVAHRMPYECAYTVRHAKTLAEVEIVTVAHPMRGKGNEIIGYHGTIFRRDKPKEPT